MYKVLLAEDEELILQGLSNLIDWEKLGLQIIHMAENGQEALTKLKKEPVDIIVTDISMPIMDGLDMLREIRNSDSRTRCIILSGYDDFEYAQSAIRLDVENYILKPINEEELESVLKDTINHLKQLDRREQHSIKQNQKLLHFLTNTSLFNKNTSNSEKKKSDVLTKEEEELLSSMGISMREPYGIAANIKIKLTNTWDENLDNILYFLSEGYQNVPLQTFYYAKDEILLFIFTNFEDREIIFSFFSSLQNEIEAKFEVLTFITISHPFQQLTELRHAFRETKRLQKYLIIEGYGSCIDESIIKQRTSEHISVDIDAEHLHKLILTKNKQSVRNYIENLFIYTIQTDMVTTNVIYHMAIKLAIILQDIIDEFKLSQVEALKNVSELIEELYMADDLSVVKSLFIAEALEMIDSLHTENSHYTPVVRQIISEVEKNYKDDMNLKTLSYKYNMNASYLGQIFQKEVGCSFSQYLSNMKNSKARELILNTNMKINDIAKEVGYPDASYFYRKFKQCYGISPASLREMKKY